MRRRSALSVLWAAVACAAMAAAAVQTNQAAAFDPQTINQVLGVPLFADTCLWNDDADTVAARLRLPPESRTSYQSSYRAYPDAAARILGARPYSVVLYGDTGIISSVSIVFANKGDVEGLSSGGDRKDTKTTSDSWGPEFAERWMTEEEADAIGSGELWTIAW